jgi:hypothetical protein
MVFQDTCFGAAAGVLCAVAFVLVGCETFQNPAAGEEPPRIDLEPAVAPAADPDHDDSYRGIYKGVLTTPDGSGMFELDIRNDDPEQIVLQGTYKGETFSLRGEEQFDPAENEYTYTFEGETEGAAAAEEGGDTGAAGESGAAGAADETGAAAASDEAAPITFMTAISIVGEIDRRNTAFRFDGEPVNVNVMKESSDALVRVYEGRYSGVSEGTWNFIRKGTDISGYYAGDGEGRFLGVFDSDAGRVRVWGERGNLIARGVVEEDGTALGAWRYDAGSAYSSETAAAAYPELSGGPAETETGGNTWRGERTL